MPPSNCTRSQRLLEAMLYGGFSRTHLAECLEKTRFVVCFLFLFVILFCKLRLVPAMIDARFKMQYDVIARHVVPCSRYVFTSVVASTLLTSLRRSRSLLQPMKAYFTCIQCPCEVASILSVYRSSNLNSSTSNYTNFWEFGKNWASKEVQRGCACPLKRSSDCPTVGEGGVYPFLSYVSLPWPFGVF